MMIKKLLLAVGCAALLCGCTKSNIVNPDRNENGAMMEPDFNIYHDIELDYDQLQEDVLDIYMDEGDYPMAAALEFEVNKDDGYVDVVIAVTDDASSEDISWYADQVIKGINNEVVVQDLSYGEAGEETFGGLYQENEIRLKIYRESEYESDGEPLLETTVPGDTYMVFEIEE